VDLWGFRMSAVTLDRLVNLHLNRLGWMNAGMRAFLKETVQPGMSVVDVGANQGLFTLLLSRLTGPSGRVVAFEPDPELFRALDSNCRVNRAVNVTLHNLGLGSRAGNMILYRSLFNAGDNRLATGLPEGSFRREMVNIVTLDEMGPDRIDFIKMDVQGWEWEVVRGMRLVMERNPAIRILFEFWPHGLTRAGCAPEDLLGHFRQLGFDLHEVPGGERIDDDVAYCHGISGTGFVDLLATGTNRS
jgi:FkbM family methyltransferase